jgi:hypothetical protein
MFEQFFTQPATIAHHHSSPYATERRQYLSHLMEEGAHATVCGSLRNY